MLFFEGKLTRLQFFMRLIISLVLVLILTGVIIGIVIVIGIIDNNITVINGNISSIHSPHWVKVLVSVLDADDNVLSISSLHISSISLLHWGTLLIFILILTLYIIYVLAISARRLRDLGHNPWWTLAHFIPYVVFPLWIYLLFAPSKIDKIQEVPHNEHK